MRNVADTAPTGNCELFTLNPDAVDYQGGEYDPSPPPEALALMRADFERGMKRPPSPWFADYYRRTLATIRKQQRLAALRTRQPPATATRARTASRTPRRPRQAPTRAVSRDGGDSGDDGPPGPPLLVDQRSAGPLLGWTARRFLEFLKRKSVPHVVDRRRHTARLDDVLDALGLPPRQPVQAAPETPAWDRDRFLRLVDGGKAGAK